MSVRTVTTPLRVLGTGSTLPGPRVSNDSLLDAIELHCGARTRRRATIALARLGIEGRHLSRALRDPVERAREADTNPKLAAAAVTAALGYAGHAPAALGYLLGHTTSPHTSLPPNVSWVADELHYGGPYVELRQACTGFANALQLASGMLTDAAAAPIAIVGSETGSLHFEFSASFVNREQIVNCVQMCDGAGAVVLGPGVNAKSGVIEAAWFGALGQGRAPGFWMDNAVNGHAVSAFRHDYRAVRKHGPSLFEAGVEAAASLGFPVDEVDYVLPHQANGRMAAGIADAFDIDEAHVIADGAEIGNLGSASIWVSFDHLLRSGRVQPGQTLLVLGAEATKYMYGGFVYRH